MQLISNCPDCGTAIGQPHKDDCDVERCSSCGQQRIGCACTDHNPAKSVWTGEWPVQPSMEEVEQTLVRDIASQLLREFSSSR
jgi:hypothetical protein